MRNGIKPEDHGGSALPFRGAKVSCFEGGVRVPTVLWGPGRVPAGKVCDQIGATIDLFPTLAHLSGATMPSDRVIDGTDISHLFHGKFEEGDPNKAFYYYLRGHLQAVRIGQWKLHLPREAEPIGAHPFSKNIHIHPNDRIGFEEPFLVDLQTDPGETKSVAGDYPEIVESLLNLAEKMREDLGDYNRIGENMRFAEPNQPRPTKLTYFTSKKKKK
jgi:arylsulfatase